jgi:hypothetical protein
MFESRILQEDHKPLELVDSFALIPSQGQCSTPHLVSWQRDSFLGQGFGDQNPTADLTRKTQWDDEGPTQECAENVPKDTHDGLIYRQFNEVGLANRPIETHIL